MRYARHNCMIQTLGILMFAIAAFFAGTNFYFSFIGPCISRWFGWKLRRESVTPFLGNLFLIAALALLKWSVFIWLIAIVLCAIDTGGIFWFCAVMFWRAIIQRKS